MRLHLLRHPSVAASGICYGHTDVALSDKAEAEIRHALTVTPTATRIMSSDLSRARILADRLGARDGVAVETDARLRELYFGAWENRPWKEIGRAASDPWAADPWNVRPPGGETFAELSERVNAALAELEPDTIVVAHAGAIRVAQLYHENAPLADLLQVRVPHAIPLELTLRWPSDPA